MYMIFSFFLPPFASTCRLFRSPLFFPYLSLIFVPEQGLIRGFGLIFRHVMWVWRAGLSTISVPTTNYVRFIRY